MDKKLVIDKLSECQDLAATIGVLSHTLDEMNRKGLIEDGTVGEYHVFGLNRAVKLLADYQSKTIDFIEDLINRQERFH